MSAAVDPRPLWPLLDAIRGPDANLVSEPPRARQPSWSGVAHDSRRVAPGDVFVAISGARHEGLTHAREALAAGAVALVAEEDPGLDAPLIRVRSARRALGRAARFWAGAPSRALRVIAVTGTNGKSTVAWMVRDLLRHMGLRVGLLGTLLYDTGKRRRAAPLTTPDALELQSLLAEMVEAGCDAAVLEASSHGLDLHRLEGCDVHVGVYTNLSRDHLDYHGSMERYREVKLRLIDQVRHSTGPWDRAVVYDRGVAAWRTIPERADRLPLVVYDSSAGECCEGAYSVCARGADLRGSTFALHGPDLPAAGLEGRLPLPGRHNLANALAALSACVACGLDPAALVAGLAEFGGVPGRLEPVAGGAGTPRVLVDYAHTPDAVARVLRELRPLVPGRLIAVFGCGGDRDRGKRPEMGRAATTIADLAILTNDNPRSEDPRRIADDVLAGVEGSCELILDRREAIARAIDAASREDVVVLLGKGHEDYQIVGSERRAFDDRQVAAALLEARAGESQS